MEPSAVVARAEDSSSVALTLVDRPRTSLELRVARFSRAILLALGLAVVLATIAGAGLGTDASGQGGADGARLGGDFPAFYGAGAIVWAGDIDDLYDPARQQVAQEELGIDGYLAFAYTPHVAAAYAPLSALDFQVAYVVHTIVMALAFAGTLLVLGDVVPLVRRWRWPLAAAGLTFYPLFSAVGGGQNAPLTLFLLAVVWRGLADDRPMLTGVAGGLMLYRPQYAIPVIGVLVLSRQGRAVLWAAVVGLITWLATAAVLGFGWVSTWFDQVLPFVERDAEVNAANSISFLGFLQAAWGADARPAVLLGAAAAAVVVLVLMALWSRPDRFSLADRMGALAIGITLISPHTMFYDASLMLIAGAAVLWRAGTDGVEESRKSALRIIGMVWLAALLHVSNDGFGASPLAIVVAGAFVAFVIDAVGRRDRGNGAVPAHA